MAKVVILLGTNLGDKKANLQNCIELLENRVGAIEQLSSIFASHAWGFESSNEFYNQVAILNTKHEPQTVLGLILEIEKDLGRLRHEGVVGYQDRLMDVDILFYDDLILESPDLIIPHPHLHKRRFTLAPLNQLLPNFIHPKLQLSIEDLLKTCPDQSEVSALK